MRAYILGFLAWLLYRLLTLTWRVTLIEPPDLQQRLKNHTPTVLAHWHGDETVLISLIGTYHMATITSTSKDGQIMDVAIRLLGGRTSRGSSTRGAITALKGLVRIIKAEGRNCSMAVDGPKGPIYKAKPGVFEMSRLIDAPIYCVAVACDRAWRFEKSWNKTYLPKPFSRVIIFWGYPPLPAVRKDQDPRSEELALNLENALHRLRSEAFKKIAADSV